MDHEEPGELTEYRCDECGIWFRPESAAQLLRYRAGPSPAGPGPSLIFDSRDCALRWYTSRGMQPPGQPDVDLRPERGED